MKCPRCQATHKRRAGMTCACGNEFVFDPKQGFGFSDVRFARVLRSVGAGGTRYFTKGQLGTAFLMDFQKSTAAHKAGIIAFTVLGLGVLGAAGVGLIRTPGLFFALPGVVWVSYFWAQFQRRRRRIPPDELDQWVTRWTKSYGPIERLLTQPMLTKAPVDEGLKDLFAYGVEHVLIVDEQTLVDFLALNGWAAQHHCLVVAERGYPTHIADLARRFLDDQPELPVWLYHASPRTSMAADLASAGWSLEGHPVRDLGLSPDVVRRAPFVKQHYPGIDPRDFRPDMLPASLLLSELSACLAGGDAFLPVLLAGRAAAGGADAGSDFG